MPKDVVDFIEEDSSGLDLFEVCLNPDNPDLEFLQDEYRLDSSQPLTIVRAYEKDGTRVVDVRDHGDKIHTGINASNLRPYGNWMNQAFQGYLKRKV